MQDKVSCCIAATAQRNNTYIYVYIYDKAHHVGIFRASRAQNNSRSLGKKTSIVGLQTATSVQLNMNTAECTSDHMLLSYFIYC